MMQRPDFKITAINVSSFFLSFSFSEKLFIGKGLHFQPSVLDFGIQ